METVDQMAEQAKILRYVEELLPHIAYQCDRDALLQAIDAAGWNVEHMKYALITEGYMRLSAGKSNVFVDREFYPRKEEHVGNNPIATQIIEQQNDLTIRAIGRYLGLTVPLPRQSSEHTARIRAPAVRRCSP